MNKIKWYINRFSLMSPLEVSYRMKEEIRARIEFIQINKSIHIPSVNTRDIRWYFDFEGEEKVIRSFRENINWKEEKAQKLLNHKFTFFSFEDANFGESINWHKDYKNDREAPLKFSKFINYRDFEEVGDIKYIWEINRHQHLISLSKAYYLTKREEYKKEVVTQILDWIEKNPYLRGVNWLSSLELAIRLISWSWVWFFLDGEIEEDFKNKWLETIYKHCLFISKNFSKYSSANNHLIGEAAGLFIATLVWDFDKRSQWWRDRSFNILIEEIEKQNYEDGVNKEQAIWYQQFILDFFILAGILGEKNNIEFPKKYWKRIEKMLEFIASIMDKEGNIPNIGDSDSGYAVILSDEKDFNPFKSLLATGAVLFERGDFKYKVKKIDEKTFWILGEEGLRKFRNLKERKFVSLKTFSYGGYYILSSDEDTDKEIKCIFDCGPLGYLSICAHGHADALSFTLSVGGRKFLIDPGTYAYHTQKVWREYFKGTSAHNTLRIDFENQAISGGGFMWIKKYKTNVLEWKSNNEYDYIKAEHNGYRRLKDSVICQREMLFNKKNKIFEIKDKIISKKKHRVEQFFHISKECSVENIGHNEWRIDNLDKSIVLKMDEKLEVGLYQGSLNPILGWESNKFDVRDACFTLRGGVVDSIGVSIICTKIKVLFKNEEVGIL